MTDRKLRAALLSKLDVSPQAISQRIQRMRDNVPMSTEDGWYVIAAMEKIDISKYLDTPTVDKIRGLVKEVRGAEITSSPVDSKPNRRTTTSERPTIIISPDLKLDDPLISSTVATEAKLMAGRVYPILYIFENSLRAFIIRVMDACHGKSWWNSHAPSSVTNPVADRMKKEERVHWHGKRSAHPIYYTDTPHLVEIVDANWDCFKVYLPNKGFFIQRVSEINVSRRVVAHNNPLSKDDQQRLEVFFKDWERHLTGVISSLP